MNTAFKCGFISIIGRSNVGKSTLMNHLLGQKISITSKKIQTTRLPIRGIVNYPQAQLILLDTPGFQLKYQNALYRCLNDHTLASIQNSELTLWVVEANRFIEMDQMLLKQLPDRAKVFLVINKKDLFDHVAEKQAFIKQLSPLYPFQGLFAVSAKHHQGLERLIQEIIRLLPESPALYPENMITDRSSHFLVAEIIREKIFRYLGQELPYVISVQVSGFTDAPKLVHIDANLLVEKTSHKGILIGKNGEKLKKIGSKARLDIEKLLHKKVFLQTWVKVKSNNAEEAEEIALLKELEP